tara:strand:+ start:335 stop:1591 length:1257 start_codon:yes stop_codon:yes gene_type:complete
MDWVKLTDEFNSIIYDISHTENNYFITGKAGTGKSTLLQYINATLNKKCVLLAPTGRAAINIKGQTLHSFFYLDTGVLQPKDFKSKSNKKIKNIDTFIIDEISMVRADVLDSINEIMKASLNSELPFGGKQVIMFGDPFQLPPVVPNNNQVRKYFNEYYDSPYFFDSNVYNEADILPVELTKVFRQTDKYLIDMLNRFRNDSYNNDDIDEINTRVSNLNLASNKIILTPYRKKAHEINTRGLLGLAGQEKYFRAKISGDIKLKNLPVPETLVLKEGAKVMFVRNSKFWVNGSLGVVEEIFRDEIIVNKDGQLHSIEPEVWEEYRYIYNQDKGELERHVIGTFTQIPLILAWAITIHKSQGATISSVHIDLDRGSFDHGQTYVALSRTKEISDISLSQPIDKNDIKVDPRVKNFYLRTF